MSTRPCSYEIQPPPDDGLRPATVHPDPAVYARMAAIARGNTARRFALCRYTEAGPTMRSSVFPEYLGWEHREGVTITDHHGHPLGWYTSIDSAHHHLTEKRNTSLWLVWLEPATRFTFSQQGTAGVEAARGEPGMFVAGVGFIAAGPADARLQVVRLVEAAESFVPDVMRQTCITHSSIHGMTSVFCSQPGCVKDPQHPGAHEIPPADHPCHEPPTTDPAEWNLTTAEAETIANARADAVDTVTAAEEAAVDTGLGEQS